jgi:hypothetical protein
VVTFTEPARTAPPGLHVCPSCQSELVQPMAWEEALADHWMLTLECPNCGWTAEGVYDRRSTGWRSGSTGGGRIFCVT